LISADFMGGKSDPYVIVDGLTTTGQFLFMYRTRTIQNNLNPKWNEWFFFQVPPDPDDPRLPVALSAVQFTIWDSDEGDAFDGAAGSNDKEGDDLLGRASVDVSYMRNTDFVQEELPLLGIKAQPGGYVNRGGFRRYSTISIEVRVERRIMRVIDPDLMPDPNMMKVPRHIESREFPPQSYYKDLSQEINQEMADETRARDAAGRVMKLRESNGLLAQAHRRARPVSPREMMAPPPVPVRQRPKSACSLTKSAPLVEQTIAHRPKSAGPCRQGRVTGTLDNFEQKLQQSQADPYDLDFVGRLPPAQHCPRSCLPILSTKFGNPRYHELTADCHERAIAGYVKPYVPPSFVQEERDQSIDNVFQNLTNRPSTEHYKVHRPIPTRPATAAARRMTIFPNNHDGPSLARHWESRY